MMVLVLVLIGGEELKCYLLRLERMDADSARHAIPIPLLPNATVHGAAASAPAD